jgi:RNA polymerase sigma factor (sigma-70 family)
MNGDTTADLRDLVERLRSGDDSARRQLLDRVYHRLRRIAASMFHKDFPRLRAQHDVESVVDEAWARLMKAIETRPPESVEHFYALVFQNVRHVLLDMVRNQARNEQRVQQCHDSNGSPGSDLSRERGDDTHDPSRLAIWTEFHQEVEKLPAEERLVFDLHYLGEFNQVEVARLLDMHPKRVSRLWLAATGRLAHWLDGFRDVM